MNTYSIIYEDKRYSIIGYNTFEIKDVLKKYKFFWNSKLNRWQTFQKKNIENLIEFISKNLSAKIYIDIQYNEVRSNYKESYLPILNFTFDSKSMNDVNNYLYFKRKFGKDSEDDTITYYNDESEYIFKKLNKDEYIRIK